MMKYIAVEVNMILIGQYAFPQSCALKSNKEEQNIAVMKFQVYFMAMFTSTIGYILAQYMGELINLKELVNAIFWFLIALTTYFGSRRLKDETWFKLLSIDFILTWIFTTIGVILGVIILILIDQNTITLDLDNLMTTFFFTLPVAIGPAATASLGLRDK